ncbi:MAG: Peptide deformylase [Candidatus Saccharibacteria bacterium]|nr:Peptide deformylase [Candidatus Saccharibacteria bacterium]
MCHTLEQKSAGIGLAATQVGESVAVAVIGIKPTPSRPNLKRQELIMINPVVIKTYGHRTGMWEACISGTDLYAMALRYKKVRLRYQDEDAKEHERDFEGLMAHVIQHEVDHLNGILFVDRVKDTSTYMTGHEYRKMKKHEGITPKT